MTDTRSTTARPRGGRFASLDLPVFRRLLIGGTFSFLAMMVSVTARGWLAFELTGSNAALGGVLIGFGLSSIVMMPVGGVLADRLPKRNVLLVTAVMQSSVSLALGIAVVADVAAYWMLIVASVVQGAAISLLGPARLAFIAEIVDRDRLTNGVMLSQSSMQMTRVFGPAVAGALIGIEAFGVGGVYFIAAGCAVISLFLNLGLPSGRPLHPPTRSPLSDLRDGARFVRNNRSIGRLLVLSYLVVLVGFPHVAFLPVVAEDLFDAGSAGFGILTTASAVGALVVSLALADIDTRRLQAFQSGAAVLFGLSVVLLGVAPAFAVALVAMVAIGATSAAFQSLNNSLVLSGSPVEYHGRVQSLLMLGFSGFGLAALPVGLIADEVGLRPTLVAMGVLTALIAVAYILIDLRRPVAPAVTV